MGRKRGPDLVSGGRKRRKQTPQEKAAKQDKKRKKTQAVAQGAKDAFLARLSNHAEAGFAASHSAANSHGADDDLLL